MSSLCSLRRVREMVIYLGMIREKKRVEGQNREQLENLKKTEAVVLDKRRDGSGVAAAGNHGTKNCCNN
jgi:hypothetical protein